jgi:hypothetical protein
LRRRYWARESDTATSITVRLCDSASMAQAEDGLAKLDYGRLLVAALALLALRQGDAVGLYALSDADTQILPPQRGQRHLHRVFRLLESLAPVGAWPGWPRLERLFTAGGTRGLTVLVSDLCEREEEIRTVAAKLAALRHDVAVPTSPPAPTSRSTTTARPPSRSWRRGGASSWTPTPPARPTSSGSRARRPSCVPPSPRPAWTTPGSRWTSPWTSPCATTSRGERA